MNCEEGRKTCNVRMVGGETRRSGGFGCPTQVYYVCDKLEFLGASIRQASLHEPFWPGQSHGAREGESGEMRESA